MRFAIKKSDSKILSENLEYPKDRPSIREQLKNEQLSFCAYSERYLRDTDAADIEHFDNTLKNTDSDGYQNWFLVIKWANIGKLDIKKFLPIYQPPEAYAHIQYNRNINQYEAKDKTDTRATNLINFLDLNHEDLSTDRLNALKRIAKIAKYYPDKNELVEELIDDPIYLDFITAIEAYFDISLYERIPR
jgi:hypothetical protein